MTYDILQKLGLSSSEIRAYVCLLEQGSCVASFVAKSAGLNRSNCYEALKRLIVRGLVTSVVKNKRTVFEAVDPKYLLDLYKENEVKLSEAVCSLEKSKKSISQEVQQATIFEGYAGIKSVFEDILETLQDGDEYLVFGAVDTSKVIERYLVHWTKRRVEKNISLKIIYHEEAKSFIAQTKEMPLTEIRVLPKSYITPAAANVYGDKTATIIWNEKPLAFVVRNKDYAESFRSYFNLLWGIAKNC